MSAYVISDVGPVANEDQDAFDAYVKLVPATIEKYGGRYLARAGTIDVMEGDWRPSALVIVEFPDREAAARWYASAEYAEALKVRARSGLRRGLVCVDGVGDADPRWE